MSDVIDRKFSAQLDCHYLLRAPEKVDERTSLVVTLHGFGMNPETMLDLTAKLFRSQPVIASVQGPYQFFLNANIQEVGYGWITNRRPAESIRLHRDMVSHVLNSVGEEFGINPSRRLLAGFSQPVSLNYRFAATCPQAVRGVVAICGGVPSDWETADYQPVTASVLHIARKQDQFYSTKVVEQYPERLRRRAADVEFHLLEGGHQIPSTGADIVEPWLQRLLGGHLE
jgi:phospholipase/carboxylesterase